MCLVYFDKMIFVHNIMLKITLVYKKRQFELDENKKRSYDELT